MLWVRSWPAVIPPGRRYVVDSLPRLVIEGYDLATADPEAGWCLGDLHPDSLARAGEPTDRRGFFLVEWDIAYSPGDKLAMERAAAQRPDEVCVAPYKLYPVSTGLLEPVWAHSNGELPGTAWSVTGDDHCDHFALGMAYLPWALVTGFMRDRSLMSDPRFTDTNFSLWHFHTIGKRVRIAWAARPVHLHW